MAAESAAAAEERRVAEAERAAADRREGLARLTGQVNAKAIIVAGELNGNVLGADKVELLESGVVNGDIKTGTLTVAAGSRMRGQVDFGWKDKG